jgi:alpha-beta hydrolase superfamily lysophospholipase
MAEHSARYQRFAEALVAAGYAVWAHDHRGHGRTAGTLDRVGILGDADGFFRMVADTREVTLLARAAHPGVPVSLFGHSMGSFVCQSYLQTWSDGIDGCILSGTNGKQGLKIRLARLLARAEAKKTGRDTPSPKLNTLSFGSFNRAFRPNRTPFDWLSRDAAEVDQYIADPWCGAVFTAGFFADFLDGLVAIEDPRNLAKVPPSLPMLLVAGAEDPVGNRGRGPRALAQTYRSLGLGSVELILYPGARHEILNETNRDEVTADILRWLGRR